MKVSLLRLIRSADVLRFNDVEVFYSPNHNGGGYWLINDEEDIRVFVIDRIVDFEFGTDFGVEIKDEDDDLIFIEVLMTRVMLTTDLK